MDGMEHKSILPILAIHDNITYTVLSQKTKFTRTTMEIHFRFSSKLHYSTLLHTNFVNN